VGLNELARKGRVGNLIAVDSAVLSRKISDSSTRHKKIRGYSVESERGSMAEKTKLDFYYQYNDKFGDIARNSALAGFAVIWLFHFEAAGRYLLPNRLAFVAFLLVGCLATDLIHYFAKTLYWAFWASEFRTPENEEKLASKIGMTTIMLIIIKFVFIFAAFVELGLYLNTHIGAFGSDNPPAQQVMQPATRP
jgi:hypothetical protein